MTTSSYGWTGSVLHIDLTRRTWRTEHPDPETYRVWIGGRGMAGHYLRPHCTLSWDDPSMPVLLFAGPLAGTDAPASARGCIMSRSPLTGAVGDSSFGGRFAVELKRAGWDGVVVTGRANALVGIHVSNREVWIEEAAPLREATTDLVFDAVEAMMPGAGVACIGPAAENGSRVAAVMVDRYHAAARCGLGLSLAAKNCKYLAVRGSGAVAVRDPGALREAREDILRLTAASPVLQGQHGISRWGTGALFDLMDSRRMMPTDNFRRTRFMRAGKLNAPAYGKQYEPHGHGCAGCHIRCKRIVSDGRALPGFEAMSHFTALLGNADMETVMEANELCAQLGLDPVSAGATLACKRELSGEDYTRETLLEALGEMALGSTLGQGARHFAKTCGIPEASMDVKGLELPACDPRGAYGLALAYAVNTRGGCHQRAYPLSHEILRKPVATDRFSFSGKARIIKIAEDTLAAVDSLAVCRLLFLAASLEEYTKAYNAVTGEEISGNDLLRAGERICYNERIMNSLNGFSARDDDLPLRFFEEGGYSGGGVDIRPLDREGFLRARERYYRIRGLDDEGRPTREKTKELGLEES
ncbi:aldehyde ferredoxin oxidoreductase family protein [Salidesulfovibrio onnuriiensis]|uniref:aldehyde ferredoxin oxidoreductase family protein n=1 Tax=Salidesulfovibrio onnuriiensis TaxID=2583823 RepID=UPI0011CC14C3|nr:aldehyde ferredoxin oxidoreductase C-terminal domain-containing protein [Salidesulfovibrio onnuriiensis]